MRVLGVRLSEEQLAKLEAVFLKELAQREHLAEGAGRSEIVRRLFAAALAQYEAGGWERLEHAS